MMAGFIRVRAADGPKHEFHAAADEVAANPDLYVVIDKTVVAGPEAPKYVVPDARPVLKKSAQKSVGEKKEGEA